MNRLCRCGGRIKRTDIVRVHVNGKIMYQDTDNLVANFECDSCHLTYTQKKRQSKKVMDGPKEVEAFRKLIQNRLDENAKGNIAFYVLVNLIAGDCDFYKQSQCYLNDRAEKGV